MTSPTNSQTVATNGSNTMESTPRSLNFDEDFKNFDPNHHILSVLSSNRANVIDLGLDPESEDDTVFGAQNIYCGSHYKVHAAGQCIVRIARKRPLNSTDLESAKAEAIALGLISGGAA